MSRHISIEELSAYLDGEADDPLGVAQHITECPECAERYHGLRALSECLQEVPEREVRPEFLGQVMARLNGVPIDRNLRYAAPRWRVATLTALAATLLITLGLQIFRSPEPGMRGPTTSAIPSAAVVSDQEERLAAVLTGVVDEKAVSSEELLAALAEEDWFAVAEPDFEDHAAIDAAAVAATDEDSMILEEILYEYSKEEDVT